MTQDLEINYKTLSLQLHCLSKFLHTWGRNWHKLSIWMFKAATCSSTVFRVVGFLLINHVDVLFTTCISRVIMIFSGALDLINKKSIYIFWEYRRVTRCQNTLVTMLKTYWILKYLKTEQQRQIHIVSHSVQYFNDEWIPPCLLCNTDDITNICKS